MHHRLPCVRPRRHRGPPPALPPTESPPTTRRTSGDGVEGWGDGVDSVWVGADEYPANVTDVNCTSHHLRTNSVDCRADHESNWWSNLCKVSAFATSSSYILHMVTRTPSLAGRQS